SFSIAGKRRGFEDTRGTICLVARIKRRYGRGFFIPALQPLLAIRFFEVARILKDKRPEYFIISERVKNQACYDFFERTHNKGKALILENVKGFFRLCNQRLRRTFTCVSVQRRLSTVAFLSSLSLNSSTLTEFRLKARSLAGSISSLSGLHFVLSVRNFAQHKLKTHSGLRIT
ncbi:MAG: hypothetical protein LUE64_03715, partial [Candidatus Gastranaerophilales bacterium]|nr:hypothetical protein [Candidatus Gastranaerophilales bacterium]